MTPVQTSDTIDSGYIFGRAPSLGQSKREGKPDQYKAFRKHSDSEYIFSYFYFVPILRADIVTYLVNP
jgi:hypothetical protein